MKKAKGTSAARLTEPAVVEKRHPQQDLWVGPGCRGREKPGLRQRSPPGNACRHPVTTASRSRGCPCNPRSEAKNSSSTPRGPVPKGIPGACLINTAASARCTWRRAVPTVSTVVQPSFFDRPAGASPASVKEMEPSSHSRLGARETSRRASSAVNGPGREPPRRGGGSWSGQRP